MRRGWPARRSRLADGEAVSGHWGAAGGSPQADAVQARPAQAGDRSMARYAAEAAGNSGASAPRPRSRVRGQLRHCPPIRRAVASEAGGLLGGARHWRRSRTSRRCRMSCFSVGLRPLPVGLCWRSERRGGARFRLGDSVRTWWERDACAGEGRVACRGLRRDPGSSAWRSWLLECSRRCLRADWARGRVPEVSAVMAEGGRWGRRRSMRGTWRCSSIGARRASWIWRGRRSALIGCSVAGQRAGHAAGARSRALAQRGADQSHSRVGARDVSLGEGAWAGW